MFYTRFLNSYMNQNLKKRDFARARSLFKRKDIGMKRYFMAFIGVILIGFNVTLLNLSGFGVDTFSCMNMAVSEHLPFSYGVWQIIVNIVIFIGLFIFLQVLRSSYFHIVFCVSPHSPICIDHFHLICHYTD